MQAATLAIILLAFFGPFAISVATSSTRSRRRPIVANVVAQIFLSATTIIAVFLCVSELRRPLADIGLSLPNWRTPLVAIVFVGGFLWVVGPLLARVPRLLGPEGVEAGLAALNEIPSGLLVETVFVVAVSEEILYRGVGLNLSAEMIGMAPAVSLTSAAFALAHAPLWGPGPASTIGLTGGLIFSAYYLLSGDLWAVVLAHIVIDLSGIVAARFRRGGPPSSSMTISTRSKARGEAGRDDLD